MTENMVANKLLGISWTGNCVAAVSLLEFGNVIFMILGIISLLISITASTITLYYKVKMMLKDKRIDAKEAAEIVKDLNEIKNNVEEFKNGYNEYNGDSKE